MMVMVMNWWWWCSDMSPLGRNTRNEAKSTAYLNSNMHLISKEKRHLINSHCAFGRVYFSFRCALLFFLLLWRNENNKKQAKKKNTIRCRRCYTIKTKKRHLQITNPSAMTNAIECTWVNIDLRLIHFEERMLFRRLWSMSMHAQPNIFRFAMA